MTGSNPLRSCGNLSRRAFVRSSTALGLAAASMPLTRAVWRLLGDANTHRRWDATVRADAS